MIAGSGRAAGPVLDATVGPGFSIALEQGGTPVTTLAPGAYTIDVSDMASLHDFHLQGPGVDEATSIPGTGTETWNVTFAEGQYTFRCDAHPSSMNGAFTVATTPVTSTASSTGSTTATAAPPSSTTTTTTAVAPPSTTSGTTTTVPPTSTDTPSTPTTTRATPTPAKATVQSVRVRVQRRRVLVRVDMSRPAAVRARLLRGPRALAIVRRQVGAEPATLTLRVPRAARAGRYTVEVVAVGRRIVRTVVVRG
jgi:hypothetical protein